MTRDKKDVEAGLLNKGFLKSNKDHRYFIYYTAAGKKTTAKTHTSHGSKSKRLSDDLLSKMSRQCHLTKQQFLNLVDCTLLREDYEELLAGMGNA